MGVIVRSALLLAFLVTAASAPAIANEVCSGTARAVDSTFGADLALAGASALSATAMVHDYNAWTKNAATDCGKSDHDTYFAQAVLHLWNAWVAHVQGGDDSGLTLAKQMLAKCTADYFATDLGARCEQYEKIAIQWEDGDWSAVPP